MTNYIFSSLNIDYIFDVPSEKNIKEQLKKREINHKNFFDVHEKELNVFVWNDINVKIIEEEQIPLVKESIVRKFIRNFLGIVNMEKYDFKIKKETKHGYCN
jgi:BioD-like phosphotransacetylase family protein